MLWLSIPHYATQGHRLFMQFNTRPQTFHAIPSFFWLQEIRQDICANHIKSPLFLLISSIPVSLHIILRFMYFFPGLHFTWIRAPSLIQPTDQQAGTFDMHHCSILFLPLASSRATETSLWLCNLTWWVCHFNPSPADWNEKIWEGWQWWKGTHWCYSVLPAQRALKGKEKSIAEIHRTQQLWHRQTCP